MAPNVKPPPPRPPVPVRPPGTPGTPATGGVGQAGTSTVTTGSEYQNVTLPPSAQNQGTSPSATTVAPASQNPVDTSQNDIAAFFGSGPSGYAPLYSPGAAATTPQTASTTAGQG